MLKHGRRVVVTGLGLVTPLAVGLEESWLRLLDGQSGIRKLTEEDLPEAPGVIENLPCRIAGCVTRDEQWDEASNTKHVSKKMPLSVQFAQVASIEALQMAGWFPEEEEDREATGVSIGSGMTSPREFFHASELLLNGRWRKMSPYFVPRVLPNTSSGLVSMSHGFRGPNHTVSTACASGAHAIGDAMRMITHGEAEVMLAGGTESCIDAISLQGFARMKALATGFNANAREGSRPFDARRSGFVMGEGAGMMVLEEREHARRRGARIVAELVGYGRSGDAYHMTQPAGDGAGAVAAMKRALRDAGDMDPARVGYVNAHATSTPIGDRIEQEAIASVFGDASSRRNAPLHVSSNKGSIGHLLGAAGAVEAIFTVMALTTGKIPPNLNLEATELPGKLNLVSGHRPEEDGTLRAALTNSFGFGGTNCSLAFAK